jgi:hypothetical protein
VFQNADTLKTEVVYRRKGDTYGVLIPEWGLNVQEDTPMNHYDVRPNN